ncbi:lymphocyte antigen 6G-like [Cyclopterus lumpus]|uniref:UPAR/Ly6 domain-containing protein n=1 Tax=Cyclopterus lumpus TaxID=8103 RepID=A0A8C2WST2_CYCLU|nr:lymphocyte antigen 6G-like [Cyclopterus lumpus]
MMHLYGALILFVTLSAACGLSCYSCIGQTCNDQITCPAGFDRCSTLLVNDIMTKSCMNNKLCVDPIQCCTSNLCNSAMPTGSSVLLLLASSAIITLFL